MRQRDPLRPLLRPLPFLLPLLAAACSAPPEEAPAPVAPAPVAEQSVREGLNDSFLDPELKVEEMVNRFERESREIAAERDAIVAALELGPGMGVADVGAGTGLFMEPFAQAVGAEGRVYAVDISPPLVEHLRARAAEGGWDQVEAVLCSDRSAELPGASVDAIFVCDTYHHFEFPRNTLASLEFALRPGGRLFVLDFERIPGVSREWTLGHVRAGKEEFTAEIEAAGFVFEEEIEVDGLEENYLLRFRRP